MTAYLYDSNGDYVGFVGVDMAAGEPEPVYPATMEAEFDALVPGEGLRMLLLYTIDHFELTEHGGSVGGGWLTDKGKAVLAALEREKADNYEALFAQACIHGLRGRGKNVRLPGVSMMTSEELAAIKARAEAATPGPWEVGECNEVRAACPVVGFDRGTADEMYVRHQECTYPNCEPIGMGDAPRGYRVFICETDSGAYGPLREDAEFIAHARTDVPALLAEVERLRNEPPLAYHAISELNAAHKLLDHLGAPKTKTVHAREGSGTQEITLGISERIIAMK